METYRCEECGAIFREDEMGRWREGRGEFWGSPCNEEMAGCPNCGSMYYHEAKPCKICGSYGVGSFGEYCEDCKSDVLKRLHQIVYQEFDEDERACLNEMLGDDDLET